MRTCLRSCNKAGLSWDKTLLCWSPLYLFSSIHSSADGEKTERRQSDSKKTWMPVLRGLLISEPVWGAWGGCLSNLAPKGYFSADMNVVNPETWTPELVLQRRAVWEGAQCSTLSTAQSRDREGQPGWLWSFQQTQADGGEQCPGCRGWRHRVKPGRCFENIKESPEMAGELAAQARGNRH